MFLEFEGPDWHPTIAKVCVGNVNAITGKLYSKKLSEIKQDYIVIPEQKWLDGICYSSGAVKQFIAMPLGKGYTIEAQITDEEKFGGFQILAFDSATGRFPERDPAIDSKINNRRKNTISEIPLPRNVPMSPSSPSSNQPLSPLGASTRPLSPAGASTPPLGSSSVQLQGSIRFQKIEDPTMGIAAGGNIKQQIKEDTYGIESWSSDIKRSITVHLVNSEAYKEITGLNPPKSPVTAAEYRKAKLPWYSHYDEGSPHLKPLAIFKRILGVAEIEKKRGIAKSEDVKIRNLAIEQIKKIRTPEKIEASSIFRSRAYESQTKMRWESAIREISYVIDLNVDVVANDFALRSRCNYQLGRFRDGVVDGTLGLEKDKKCLKSLSWRAYCRKMLGDHQELDEDASALLKSPETELVGLEMKAEAALMAGRYADAFSAAMNLKSKRPEHTRAAEICNEAKSFLI